MPRGKEEGWMGGECKGLEEVKAEEEEAKKWGGRVGQEEAGQMWGGG